MTLNNSPTPSARTAITPRAVLAGPILHPRKMASRQQNTEPFLPPMRGACLPTARRGA